MMTPGTGRFSQHAGDKILIVAAAHPSFAEGRDANTRCRRTTAQVRTTGTVRMRGGRQSTGISQEPFSKAKAVARKPPLTPLARCFYSRGKRRVDSKQELKFLPSSGGSQAARAGRFNRNNPKISSEVSPRLAGPFPSAKRVSAKDLFSSRT